MQGKKVFWVVLLAILLTACSRTSTVPTFTNTPPLTATATSLPPNPTPTFIPTPAPTITPTQIPPELAGLRIAYTLLEDRNLYLWDEHNPALLLSENEKDALIPRFTDDGKKIIFMRGRTLPDLYSINPDGSQELLLSSTNILSQLGLGYDEFSEMRSYSLVPGTHQLLFTTLHLDKRDIDAAGGNRLYSQPNHDLMLVDADTGEIRQILAPGECEYFKIAPTGDMIAVVREGQIDLVDLDGQIIRRNLLTYLRTQPIELPPYLFWKEDGSELFVAVPVDPEYDMGGPETRTLWRIAVDGSIKTELAFDAPLVSYNYTVSPDGRWILYLYFYYGEDERGIPTGVYLGNLRDGGSHLLPGIFPEGWWSADSTHFIFGDTSVSLGAIDGEYELIADHAWRFGWVDASRFLFCSNQGDQIISMGNIDGAVVDIPGLSYREIVYLAFTSADP